MESFGQNMNQRKMDELLELLASEARNIDTVFSLNRSTMFSPHHYQSCIRHCGHPILPPLMTEDRRFEMAMYRQQAVMVEARLRAQSRQRLLARVQSVMSDIESKHKHKDATEPAHSSSSDEHSEEQPQVVAVDDRTPPCDSGLSRTQSQLEQHGDSLAVESRPTDEFPIGPVGPLASTPDDVPESGIESYTEKDTILVQSQEPGDLDNNNSVESTQPRLDSDTRKNENCAEKPQQYEQLVSQKVDDNLPKMAVKSGSRNSSGRRSVIDMLLNANAMAKEQEESEENVESQEEASDQNTEQAEQAMDSNVKPVSSQLATNAVSSTGSSGSTGSSEEMGGTVIINKDTLAEDSKKDDGIEGVQNKAAQVEQHVAPVDSVAFDPSLRLLSRVDLSDYTPVGTPAKGHRHNEDESEEEEGPMSISTGPMTTPNLSDISPQDSVQEEDEATQTEDLYTGSTTLAKYMATSCEPSLSGHTTLPQLQAFQNHDEDRGRTDSNVSSLRTMEENITPRSGQSKEGANTSSKSQDVTVRVLNQSFTLPHPSPVLIAAEAKKSQTGSSKSTSSGQAPKVKAVTTSMEDFKLNSKAQRRLEYDHKDIDIGDSEEKGKEEHLQRYLQTVTTSTEVEDIAYHSESEEVIPDVPSSQEALEAHYEEKFKLLVQKQQRDLAVLRSQQEQQLMVFQQEILSQKRENSGSLVQLSGGDVSNSGLLITHGDSQISSLPNPSSSSQHRNVSPQYSHVNTQVPNQPAPKTSHTPPKKSVTNVPPSPMAERQKQRYDTWLRAPVPESHTDELSELAEHRPNTAPAPKVSFHIDDVSKCSSPAGVFYDPPPLPVNVSSNMSQSSHMLSNVSVSERQHPLRQSFDQFPSPAVLKRKSQEQALNRDVSILESKQDMTGIHQSPGSKQGPVSILKKSPPCGSAHGERSPRGEHIVKSNGKMTPAAIHEGWCRLSAAVRGYLTRRLLRTDRVQNIIATIRDTAEFAIHFQQESPIKRGVYSMQDKQLQDRVMAQLDSAMYEIHDIFFEYPTREQMSIIHQDRLLLQEKLFKSMPASSGRRSTEAKKKVSSATQKALDRKKKMLLAESRVFGNEEPRPKSAPPPQNSKAAQNQSDALRRHYHFLMNRTVKVAKSSNKSPRQPADTAPHTARQTSNKPETKAARKVHVHSRTKPASSSAAPAKKTAATTSIPARKIAKGTSNTTNRARATNK